MSSSRIRGLFQLLGLALLGVGLYMAWSQYRPVAALANAFLGSEGRSATLFDSLAQMTRLGLWDLVAKQPLVWIGAALVVVPVFVWLVGRLFLRRRDSGADG